MAETSCVPDRAGQELPDETLREGRFSETGVGNFYRPW